MTSSEQEAVHSVISDHQRTVDPSWAYVKYFLVTVENAKVVYFIRA